MSEWRKETEADLLDAKQKIGSVLDSLSGEPASQQILTIWKAYIRVEKSIAFIRIEFNEENPGRFIRLKAYAVPDERQALQFALRSLQRGAEDFSLGDFHQSLRNLRESRNYLRALLREKRLERARKARTR